MKVIRHLLVAAALGGGFIGCAEAHVFIGVEIMPSSVSGHTGLCAAAGLLRTATTAAAGLRGAGRDRLLRPSALVSALLRLWISLWLLAPLMRRAAPVLPQADV